MPADLIIYAFIAVGLVFWLRNTLGTREESDEPVSNLRPPLTDIEELGTATLKPSSDAGDTPSSPQAQIEAVTRDKTGITGIEGSMVEDGLTDIMTADKNFDLKFFFSAAQDVFVMVVESFASGNRNELADMLGEGVYTAFEQAITAREQAGHTATSEVQSIREARITEARLDGKTAFITVRFAADQISVTRDATGTVLEGHPERTFLMRDVWVFSRDLRSRDPRWFVVETRSDLADDNNIIPNA